MNMINIIFVAILAISQICWCAPSQEQVSEGKTLDTTGIRDLFLPPTSFTKQKSQLESILRDISGQIQIKGVVIDREKKYVIINDEIIEERSTWRNFIIDKIERTEIIIDYEGEKIHYPIGNDTEQAVDSRNAAPDQAGR